MTGPDGSVNRFPSPDLLGLGTWLFGWETVESDARQLMGMALDHGITYFDTANNYGGGESERIVGDFLRSNRDEVIVGTKCFAPFGPEPEDRGLSRQAIIRAVHGSLDRLRTDRIDLLHLHRPDPSVPVEETAGTLTDLVRAGAVRQVATSTFHGHQIDALQKALVAADVTPAVLDQAPYSLLERQVEAVAAAAIRSWGMTVTAWSPLGEGLLTGKYADTRAEGRIRRWQVSGQERFQRGIETAGRLRELADRASMGLDELALSWLARRPLVGRVLIGARTVGQFETYLRGVQAEYPAELEPEIDSIVPPGTTVLEHYAT